MRWVFDQGRPAGRADRALVPDEPFDPGQSGEVHVHEVPGAVDGKAAIRVPVVGDPGTRPGLQHRGHQRFHVRRAAVLVDVVAVGGVMDGDHLRTGRSQGCRPGLFVA